MNRHPATSRTSYLAVSLLALLVVQVATADQILETHDLSLTTYLPSAKSNVQDVRALVDMRGVHLDGSARASSTHRMALNGNPFGQDAWNGNQMLSGVRLDTGTFVVNDVDLALPAQVPWIIGRTYNARQKTSGGSYFASAGYQGNNWFQSSQPELVFHDSGTDSEDTIYLVYGADRFIEFRRGDDAGTGDSADTFKSVNGAAGAIVIATDAEGPDLATYYDQNGNQMVFFWVNDADIDDDIEGSIWKIVDPAGNAAYVGHATNASTALSSYDATTGAITTAYDSAGRRFTYIYTSGMLTQVKAEKPGWTEVGRVDYSYYVDADAHGEDDDLELVTITMPLTDSGVSSERNKYYWYYEGTYDATNNPGYHHQLQYVIDFEGYRNYDWTQDSLLDDDPLTATEENLKAYASAFFKYDTDRRIVSAWFGGECGCGGASTGTHTFEYESNGSYSDGTGYDTAWKGRTTVQKPSVTYSGNPIESWVTQYFDEAGQPLHRVLTDDDPAETSPQPDLWATKITRNSDGQITEISSPANVTAYTHSSASFTASTSAGLVDTVTRISSGDMDGFLSTRKHKEGTSGSLVTDDVTTYTSRSLSVGDAGVTRPSVASRQVYTSVSDSNTTSYSFDYHSATSTDVQYIAVKKITTTNPTVSTGKNGSGSATTTKRYVRADGTTAFAESASGILTYTLHTDGLLTKRIDDAQTDHATDFASGDDPATDFGMTETSLGKRRVTEYIIDDGLCRPWNVCDGWQEGSGCVGQATLPNGRILKRYRSKLKDGRLVTLAYNDYEATPKFYGPVQYTVTNHAGRVEVQATVALTNNESTTALTGHVDETDSDPITAMDLGTMVRMTVSVYDETGGVLEETRLYHDIPASGAGSGGTNYDATVLGYDDQGRRVREKAPHGTITRRDYDTLGRMNKAWIGTNDNGFYGGESSGADDMVKTAENTYDSGNDQGNSYLTKRTAYVEDSDTDKRETTFSRDVQGRVLLQTNPTAPHVFNKVDNLGRVIASGSFSSTASITVGTDDPTTETTNRLALSQTFFDEMGRVWKQLRHKIDDADGSDDDSLASESWCDAEGRVVKVDGEELAKTLYDRLGRPTHRFVLASDNDSAYADADDVTGDIVLLESQTTYESYDSNDVVMTATISRFHDDKGGGETTGALDTNADNDSLKYTAANVKGRIHIAANWYDRFGRLTETVRYGTYGGSDFDRDSLSVPARSDTALLTEFVYNTDGSQLSATDPKDLEARTEYDDAGRRIAVITNYIDGTPSGDTDYHVRYVYTDGLQTKMWVDLDGDDTEDSGDQVTEYTYGTTKGASAGDSNIGTGHLLQKTTYPDSTSGTDVVTFAYNAQSQQVWTKDQDGTVIEQDFDDSGRETQKRVTTLAGGLDNAVLRIATAYDNLGRVSTVTQHDHATVGSGSVVDEVKYTYDDWGPISKFEQDHDSTVGGTLLYDITYGYGKATSGRNTIRRTTMGLPDGAQVSYYYLSSSDRHDADASRVSQVTISSGGIPTTVATYGYNGVGQVVGIDYDEIDVMWHKYGSTNGAYDDLDRFDRVTSSRWTKDLATDVDFFDLDITYDRNSNIVLVEDNVHTGFDVDFTMDDQNRLTEAEEGTWGGSSIGSRKRDEQWTLDQLGNWDVYKLDLDGDNNFNETDELDDARTHNDVNELTARDVDNDATDDYTLTFDGAGRMTDDGENYEYEYDAFGRLRKVKDTDDQSLIAEYTYNGLGYRIGWHYDDDSDGDVDGDDVWFRFVYDDRWRVVGTFRASDGDAKEQFVYHAAGDDGLGGASYIDAVVLRDKDANTAWNATADGTLEERIYYCQNWRHDVVALVDANGDQAEQARFLVYGTPFGLPAGDIDSDGDVDAADVTAFDNLSNVAATADLDLDGDNDSSDRSVIVASDGDAAGFDVLSLATINSRRGYSGHGVDATSGTYTVRSGSLQQVLGRWTTRWTRDDQTRTNIYAFPVGSYQQTGGGAGTGVGNYCRAYCRGNWGGAGYVGCLAGCVNVERGAYCTTYCSRFTGGQRDACMDGCQTNPSPGPGSRNYPWQNDPAVNPTGNRGWQATECSRYCTKIMVCRATQADSGPERCYVQGGLFTGCIARCNAADADPPITAPHAFDPWEWDKDTDADENEKAACQAPPMPAFY